MKEAFVWFCVIAGIFFAAISISTYRSAQAAPPAPPSVVACEPIAQAGQITVYRCQPEMGASFLVNSIGFMLLED